MGEMHPESLRMAAQLHDHKNVLDVHIWRSRKLLKLLPTRKENGPFPDFWKLQMFLPGLFGRNGRKNRWEEYGNHTDEKMEEHENDPYRCEDCPTCLQWPCKSSISWVPIRELH